MSNNNSDGRNMVLALGLSAVVLVVWSGFVMPRFAPPKPAAPVIDSKIVPTPSVAPIPAASPLPPAQALSREQALALHPRLSLQNAAVSGSLSLIGGRIDDIVLQKYRTQANDIKSPNVHLLSPAQSKGSYFAEFGYVSGQSDLTLPDAQSVWQPLNNDSKLTPSTPVTLAWHNKTGLTIERTVSIDDNYLITFTDTLKNAGSTPYNVTPYGRIARDAEVALNVSPEERSATRGGLGWDGTHVQEYTFDKLQKEQSISVPLTQGWLALSDKYWITAMVPSTADSVEARYSANTIEGTKIFQADYRQNSLTVPAGGNIVVRHQLFAGAKEYTTLQNYEKMLNISHFDYAIDWGYFWFVTRPMFYLLLALQHVSGQFALALLGLTLVVKTLFYPLAKKSFITADKMRRLQPKLKELRTKYSADPMAMQQHMMQLYKAEKMNPFAGFWPIFVQIPVFFGLYKVLSIALEMRHAPFYGWINDLSSADPTNVFNLFGLLPFTVLPIHIGAWPVLMGITMYLQQKLSSSNIDPQQEKILRYFPFIVTFFLASFSAGLVIYWTWSNIISIAQMMWMKRNMPKQEVLGRG